MKYLLDTHIVLWLLNNSDKMPDKARTILKSSDEEFYFSMASVWEVAIKHNKNPEDMPISEEVFYSKAFQANLNCLHISEKHIYTVKSLLQSERSNHKDPFDRLLIAQAKIENMNFLTHDEMLSNYKENCIIHV